MVHPIDSPSDATGDPATSNRQSAIVSDLATWGLHPGTEPVCPDSSEPVTADEVAPGPPESRLSHSSRDETWRTSQPGDGGDERGDDSSSSDQRPEVTAEEAEEKFKVAIHGLRLVYDFRTSQVTGIATWGAEAWEWQITPRETATERQTRRTGINLLTDLAEQAVGCVFARPSGLDQVVTIGSAVADPRTVALKLCNGAAQVLAHHLCLGFMASTLGLLVEQTLSPVLDPPSRLSGAVSGLQLIDVTVDVATGRLTPAVGGYATAELDARLQDKTQGISQDQLEKIEAAIREGQTACSKPTG